jgi:endonuclease/exonuclease/phosphatase family metal-dependent hydrolase
MRLVSWNLAHQCREAPIPPSFAEAVRLLDPDLICLNEYVHGASREGMIESLSRLGLRHFQVSQRLNGHNQVLVASRHSMEPGDLAGPTTTNLGGESNFLHVRIPAVKVEFVGLRAPSYSGLALSDYWTKLVKTVQSCVGRSIVFMGDFNTDPDQPRRATAKYLLQLRNEGWFIPSPEGPWSFISKTGVGTRIDHALLSADLPVSTARYVATAGPLALAAPNRLGALSDHAPLVLEFTAGAA